MNVNMSNDRYNRIKSIERSAVMFVPMVVFIFLCCEEMEACLLIC